MNPNTLKNKQLNYFVSDYFGFVPIWFLIKHLN